MFKIYFFCQNSFWVYILEKDSVMLYLIMYSFANVSLIKKLYHDIHDKIFDQNSATVININRQEDTLCDISKGQNTAGICVKLSNSNIFHFLGGRKKSTDS